MKLSHKTKAAAQYVAPASIAYLAAASFVIFGSSLSTTDLFRKIGGAAIVGIAATLMQDLLPKPFKEALVFFRFKYRLPGHRAFSCASKNSARYDLGKIKNLDTLRGLPPESQQRVFYKLYRKYASEIRVEHYSFRYIAWRDLSATLFVLAVITIPVAIVTKGKAILMASVLLGAGTLLTYLATALAASSMARELVVQVLAADTMGKAHVVSE